MGFPQHGMESELRRDRCGFHVLWLVAGGERVVAEVGLEDGSAVDVDVDGTEVFQGGERHTGPTDG